MSFSSYRIKSFEDIYGSLEMIVGNDKDRADAVGKILLEGTDEMEKAESRQEVLIIAQSVRDRIEGLFDELDTPAVKVLKADSKAALDCDDLRHVAKRVDIIKSEHLANQVTYIKGFRFAILATMDFTADAINWWLSEKDSLQIDSMLN